MTRTATDPDTLLWRNSMRRTVGSLSAPRVRYGSTAEVLRRRVACPLLGEKRKSFLKPIMTGSSQLRSFDNRL